MGIYESLWRNKKNTHSIFRFFENRTIFVFFSPQIYTMTDLSVMTWYGGWAMALPIFTDIEQYWAAHFLARACRVCVVRDTFDPETVNWPVFDDSICKCSLSKRPSYRFVCHVERVRDTRRSYWMRGKRRKAKRGGEREREIKIEK